MIKVLNIISDSNIGGAGRCVLNFLKYYDRKKFGIMVVMPEGSLLIWNLELGPLYPVSKDSLK